MMGTYDTGVLKVEYENEKELVMLMAMYPNEDCLDDLPCPPPPIGESEL